MGKDLDRISNKRLDYKPISDEHTLEKFIEDSVIFRDFKGEVECRIEDLRNVLEGADSKQFHVTQGAILLCRQFLNIFEDMLENRKADLEGEALDREENKDG